MFTKDKGLSKDGAAVTQKKPIKENGIWNPIWTLKKFASEEAAKLNQPFEVQSIEGNVLTDAGINELFTLACSSSGTVFDNTNAVLVVGTNATSTVEASTVTESDFDAIVGSGMMSGYPTYGSSQQTVFKAEFGGTVANQSWQEFGVLNGATGGTATLLNYKLSDQGTKVSGQVWQLELTISLS